MEGYNIMFCVCTHFSGKNKKCAFCGLDSDGVEHCGLATGTFEATKVTNLKKCPYKNRRKKNARQ